MRLALSVIVLLAASAASPSIARAQSDTETAAELRAQLHACLEAVLTLDDAPLEVWEAVTLDESQYQDFPIVLRVMRPDEGAVNIGYALAIRPAGSEVVQVADCGLSVLASDNDALRVMDTFRADMHADYGPFEPTELSSRAHDFEEVACWNGQPLRLAGTAIGQGETATRGLTVFNYTNEDLTC